MDGWEVMKKLDKQANTPVPFLTARGTLEDRLKGLDLGADDYLVKPFSFAELLARIRVALRRGNQVRQEDILDIADLQIDVPKRRVVRAGTRLTLTNKEFNLLHFFVLHKGQVLSRALIASRVWDMNFDSDTNAVDVAVRRLRQKINERRSQRMPQCRSLPFTTRWEKMARLSASSLRRPPLRIRNTDCKLSPGA